MGYSAADVRTGVSTKIPTKPGQQVDHRLELQTLADSMSALKIRKNSATYKDLKKIANDKSNLRAVSKRENGRTGQRVKATRSGKISNPGSRAVNKQLQGIKSIEKDWDLAPATRKVINHSKGVLKKQGRKARR